MSFCFDTHGGSSVKKTSCLFAVQKKMRVFLRLNFRDGSDCCVAALRIEKNDFWF